MDTKKILVYFVSFLSLSLVFTTGFYLSYKKALNDFNSTAEERNNELIYVLEEYGLIIVEDSSLDSSSEQFSNNNIDKDSKVNVANFEGQAGFQNEALAVDSLDEIIILPTTKYVLQTYNMETDKKTDETIDLPSYLLGLNRQEVVEYLDNYMEDLPWNEFREGLTGYDLLLFSDKEIIVRKTYNPALIQYEFFIKAIDGNIVVFYSDQKTVYEYTNMSLENLNEEEKVELEEGFYIKDLDELYPTLEHYTS